MATLSDYETDTLRLLRDANNSYFPMTDIDAYINRAVKQRDRDTGMNRKLVTFPLVIGQIFYTLSTVDSAAFDVVGIVLIYSNIRVDLENNSFRDSTASYGSIINYNDVPRSFSKYGANSIVIAPPPNQAYSTEWDLLVTSPTLVNATDTDPLPFPWTDPVPFLAAHFAKLEIQEHDEAQRYLQLYQSRTIEVLSNARGMFVSDPYFTQGRRWGR